MTMICRWVHADDGALVMKWTAAEGAAVHRETGGNQAAYASEVFDHDADALTPILGGRGRSAAWRISTSGWLGFDLPAGRIRPRDQIFLGTASGIRPWKQRASAASRRGSCATPRRAGLIDGVPLYDVQALLGHESYRTTEQYAHLVPDAHDKIVQSWARRRDASVTHEPRQERPS
jgi:hypothetical protein